MGVLPFDGNEFEGSVGVLRDITERKERERKLKREQQRCTMLFEALPNPVLHSRTEHSKPIVQMVNQAFTDTFGYDTEAVAGDPIQEYIVPDDRADAAERHNQEVLTSGDVRTEVQRETTDGVRTFRLNVSTRQTENGDHERYAVYTDITERKRREQELERQNQRLDEFTSIVSHDLRNPLTVAENYLELAQEGSESDHVAQAADAIDRSQVLIEDLLTLAREGDMVDSVETMSLRELAEHSWQTVETEQATLDVEMSCVINADPDRLQQLFENLYGNAIEHGGDDVTVSVGEIDDGFYVADTGSGIPEADRGVIFESGYSTNADGTGFGLRIVEQIVEAHGWEISVTDSDQGGARFEITGVEPAE
jgi:PAS domain S-box-containing protein